MSNAQPARTFDYVTEANVTASHEWHGELVNFFFFKTALARAIEALQALDKYKKTLFYGRDTGLPVPDFVESMANMKRTEQDQEIVHAIIGGATESGEMLEQLYAWATGKIKEFDTVHLIEETGDSQWYNAVMAAALDVSFDEIQRINISKLRARYKDKFAAFDANNRNESFERSVLEVGAGLKSFTVDQASAAVAQDNTRAAVVATGLPGAFDPLPGLLTPRQEHASTVAAGVEAFAAECRAECPCPNVEIKNHDDNTATCIGNCPTE